MVAVDTQSVKVHTVNGAAAGSASSLPDWLVRKRAAKAKGKRAIRERVEGTIELIQHFEFPEASNRIKTTRDGHHVIATGTYKPQMRVWDLDQLALKFERHADIENVDFIVSFVFSQPFSTPTSGNQLVSLVQFFFVSQRPTCHRIVTHPFADPF
jgi:ribosome biogenesis protein ENP2